MDKIPAARSKITDLYMSVVLLLAQKGFHGWKAEKYRL